MAGARTSIASNATVLIALQRSAGLPSEPPSDAFEEADHAAVVLGAVGRGGAGEEQFAADAIGRTARDREAAGGDVDVALFDFGRAWPFRRDRPARVVVAQDATEHGSGEVAAGGARSE